MTEWIVPAALLIAQVMLAFAMACAAARLMIGPQAQDRVLALDTLYVNAMLLILVLGLAAVIWMIRAGFRPSTGRTAP